MVRSENCSGRSLFGYFPTEFADETILMGEEYITFTQINDFLYSPASLYLHGSFVDKAGAFFKERAQVAGSLEHEAIEEGRYSTRRMILQAKTVYSERFGIVGKIDIFDVDKGELVERKNRVSELYLGYVYQVWAQYFALRETGYAVRKLSIYSKQDNKKYEVKKPSREDEKKFGEVLDKIRSFDAENLICENMDERARLSIYGTLAW